MRLDILLRERYPQFSRAYWQRSILGGKVKVNGKSVGSSHVLVQEDALIEVEPEKNTRILTGQTSVGTSLSPFEILYEDEEVLVVNKPAGIVVHPPAKSVTLLELLSEQQPFVKLVHRLDRDTSGILVLAKSQQVHAQLSAQWKERRVKKTYTVLVKGSFEQKSGRIEAPIHRSFKDRKKMAVSDRHGSRDAVTEFEVVKSFEDVSLVKAFPLTGRTHQIRVHFASIGHPVIGDETYGDVTLNAHFQEKHGLARQFLHASKLVFAHPTTKKRITMVTELPADLSSVLKSLRLQPRKTVGGGL